MRLNMDWLHQLLWHHGNFLGLKWGWWEVIGWLGNLLFSARVFVQWYATEKRKQVVVPSAFWWLSLAGSVALLTYALFAKRDSVFIFAYAFNSIPYVRNLIIHRRHKEAQLTCAECGQVCPPQANFCFSCGARLTTSPPRQSAAGDARADGNLSRR
jgi:lipid-A-disaccharide synthase-like uncharacterized protein